VNDDIAAVLPQKLAARAARWRQLFSFSDDCHFAEFTRPVAEGFPERDPLGADAQSIRGVFDIAAGIDAAAGSNDGCAHFESLKERERILPGFYGICDQITIHMYRRTVGEECRDRH